MLFTLFVENVSLFSQFYIIMHMNRNKAVMKDCAQQVQYTRNEEMLHAQVGIKLINTLREEYPDLFDEELEARVKEECIDALKAESKVIDWIMGDYEVKGLSADILKSFIAKRMADSLDQIGFDHGELSNISKHVIVGKTKVSLIDFESSSTKRRPSNVTSITQAFFIGSGIAKQSQKIYKNSSKEKIIDALKSYKQEKTRENFENLLKILKL